VTTLKINIGEAGYGKKVVLKDVSLAIEEGDIVALIGPNGAGKSTLLKVIMGLIKPTQGSVRLGNKEVTHCAPEENVRAGMLFVPQGNRVFTELTVRENLEIGGYLLANAELLKRIGDVLSLFPDLQSRLKQIAGQLSGGEKQQLALARALMLKPSVLLMDEPSLGLSPKLVTKALETIAEINKRDRTTIVIVEQKVNEVLKIATRVCGMKMGTILVDSQPELFSTPDQFKKIFL